MPELPEVELARRNFERWLEGRRVVRVESEPARTFRGARRAGLKDIRGKLECARRRGKYLLLGFEANRGLLMHFGMTGKLVRRSQGQVEAYSRMRFVLDDGQVVHFRDPRLFGRVQPAQADALLALPVIRALGPDALLDAPDGPAIEKALGRGGRHLKVALMDQARLAGLGNLHAAEALFRARLHPARKVSTLGPGEWRALAAAIRATLAFALEAEGADELQYVEEPGAENPFFVYGRAGLPCRRCQARVKSFAQAGRTTFYCPHCQPKRQEPRR